MELHEVGKLLHVHHHEEGDLYDHMQDGVAIAMEKGSDGENTFHLHLSDKGEGTISTNLNFGGISIGGGSLAISGFMLWTRKYPESEEAVKMIKEALDAIPPYEMPVIDNDRFKSVCKAGRGSDTCIFAVVGAEIQCARRSNLDRLLRRKAKENKEKGSGAATMNTCTFDNGEWK